MVHRLLKPRTPLDCPSCRLACTPSPGMRPAPALVRPWREVKSRRGAPKRVNTEGYACPNQKCAYFGITDASVHALVGDGKHGHGERIQTFRCQACRTTFSARRDTALYRLKTASHQVALVLSALAEGLDASAAERIFGYRQATITSWLTRAGRHAESLHERCFRNLHPWLTHPLLDPQKSGRVLMDHLMKQITTALQWSYAQAEVNVNPKHLEAAAEQLTLRRDRIHVVDAQNPKKEDVSEKQESPEDPEDPRSKGKKQEKRGRKKRAPEKSEHPNPK